LGNIKKQYLLIDVTQNLENVLICIEDASISLENADISNTRKVSEGRKVSKEGEAAPPASAPAPPPITKESLVIQYGQALVDTYIAKATNYHHTGDKAIMKAAEWLATDVESGKIKRKPKKKTSFDLDEYQKTVDNYKPVYINKE